MKLKAGLLGLIFVGVSGWFIGSRLSPDAIGMAVGVLFGLLAGIPAALMVLASRRQADLYHEQMPYSAQRGQSRGQRGRNGQMSPYHDPTQQMPQPPIIVFAGGGAPHQMGQPVGGYSTSGYQANGASASGYPVNGYPTGNQYTEMGAQPQQQLALPGPVEQPADRKFRMVGEQEEWIDSY